MRAAFGFGGQKCSANSRVYVERPVHDELVRLLVEKTEKLTIGDPLERENWLGPIIDQQAVDRHQQAVAEARRDGKVFTGGEHLTDGDLARGYYVEPTVVGGLPATIACSRTSCSRRSPRSRPVDSLDEALRLANDSIYGLTAGVYSEDPAEVAALPRRDRGGRAVRQPPGRRHHRRVAGRAGVRRLEGLRLDRQGRPVDVLRRPVHARAEPHGRRRASASAYARWDRPGRRGCRPAGGCAVAARHASGLFGPSHASGVRRRRADRSPAPSPSVALAGAPTPVAPIAVPSRPQPERGRRRLPRSAPDVGRVAARSPSRS